MQIKAVLDSLDGLKVSASSPQYSVPPKFQHYRDALGDVLTEKGMFNGNIMIVKGNVDVPLTVYKGGFFDFKATQSSAVPADILPELYPAGKTVADLVHMYSMDTSQLARYLGIAFIMLPDNGNELSFVHRGRGLGIAANCMALSGATPQFDEGMSNDDFDFAKYFRQIIADKMEEEYRIAPDEFETGACYLIDDSQSVPFLAIKVITEPSVEAIANRSFGDKDIIKEHPIMYSTSLNSIPELVNRFPLLPSTAYVLNEINKSK